MLRDFEEFLLHFAATLNRNRSREDGMRYILTLDKVVSVMDVFIGASKEQHEQNIKSIEGEKCMKEIAEKINVELNKYKEDKIREENERYEKLSQNFETVRQEFLDMQKYIEDVNYYE